jgi:hypothetical protein
LSGTIHGVSMSGTVDLDLIGGGTLTAVFEELSTLEGPRFELRSVNYAIAPLAEGAVPEPAMWMLLGSGLLGLPRIVSRFAETPEYLGRRQRMTSVCTARPASG